MIEKKTQLEMPRYFAELRKIAQPRTVLHDASTPDRLKEQVEPEVRDVLGPAQPGQAPAQGH